MNSQAALLTLILVSQGTMVDYVRSVASKLRIASPVVVFTEKNDGPPAWAWVAAGSDDWIVMRSWVVEAADTPYAKYLAAHEVCHIKLRHQWETDITEERFHQREVEADDCVRLMQRTNREWLEMEAAIDRMRDVSLKRKRKLLSSP